MTLDEASEIAELLNRRNGLTVKQTAAEILASADDYLIIRLDGKIAAAVEISLKQWYQAELRHLTVHEAYENRGHAGTLAARAEERAIGLRVRLIQCTIREDNIGSQRLFKAAGYRRVSVFYNERSNNSVGVWQKVLVSVPIESLRSRLIRFLSQVHARLLRR